MKQASSGLHCQPASRGNMQLPSQGQMSGIGSLYGAVCNICACFPFNLHYALLATSTAAPSSLLWRLVWRGPGRRGRSAWYLGVNQGCSQQQHICNNKVRLMWSHLGGAKLASGNIWWDIWNCRQLVVQSFFFLIALFSDHYPSFHSDCFVPFT